MAKRMKSEHRDLGRAVLVRLAERPGVPGGLRPFIALFAEHQRALDVAAATADAARKARDEALAAVAAADAALDTRVDVLANRLIGAELGPRRNAFAPFGEIPPARFKELAYAVEVERVNKLIAAVKKTTPPRSVQEAMSACSAAAVRCARALAALSGPQATYSAALGARDALLPEWTRALEKLRINAKAVWLDEPATYRAVFAPPGIDSRRARRRRSRPAPTAANAPAAQATPAEAVASA